MIAEGPLVRGRTVGSPMAGAAQPNLRSPVAIRDVTCADLPTVLAINEQPVPAVNSLSWGRMDCFARVAAYFRDAQIGPELAGFLICLAPEADYPSPNLRWLNERCMDFLYIDRVAVTPALHRRGVARALYRDAAGAAEERFHQIACEVNVRPPNPQSLALHARLGFQALGFQDHGSVKVQYMIRPLPF